MTSHSSPFTRHLGTNYAPSDDERASIRTWCSTMQSAIISLDSAIQQTSICTARTALVSQRVDLQAVFDRHMSLLTPLRRLFPELLAQIFMFCLSTEENPTTRTSQSPLLLTRVSSDWRSIAISTPSLWSALHLDMPGAVQWRVWNPQRIAMREWLGRSGSTALHISLSVTVMQKLRLSDSQALCDILSDLSGYSRRLKSISLDMPADLIHALSLSSADVPILEAVTFRVPIYQQRLDLDGPTFQFVGSLTNLRRLTVHNLSHLPSHFSTRCLRHLDLFLTSRIIPSPGTTALLELLSDSNDIETCSLRGELSGKRGPGMTLSSSPIMDPIALRHLTSFELDLAHQDVPAPNGLSSRLVVLEHLVAPQLRSLDVVASCDEGSRFTRQGPISALPPTNDVIRNAPPPHLERTFETLEQFIIRSRCSLQCLRWKRFSSEKWPESLISCLSLCPDLKELTLEPIMGSGTLIGERLLEEMLITGVCPKLEAFTLLNGFRACHPVIERFVERRVKSSGDGAGLRYLHITGPPPGCGEEALSMPVGLQSYIARFGIAIEISAGLSRLVE